MEAEQYFQKAIKLDPGKGNCYMHYGTYLPFALTQRGPPAGPSFAHCVRYIHGTETLFVPFTFQTRGGFFCSQWATGR